MDRSGIRDHWTSWAKAHGTHFKATTRGRTAKLLELDAFRRRLEELFGDQPFTALEVGCGNGINCIEMARVFERAEFDGFDFVQEMIDAAIESSGAAGVEKRTRFFVGDVTSLADLPPLRNSYDVVLTDRCLINLNTAELQHQAVSDLAGKVASGGFLLMIENSLHTHGRQNRAREAMGLQPRTPAEFNRFFTEEEMAGHIAAAGLELVEIEDFSSLHDLVLYALVPGLNGGTVDYDHPAVTAAAELSTHFAAQERNAFGSFGQNRLYVCRKS
jgi:ubiquinone/menaquinone biosynthesis C-methylase UbiE